MLVVRGSIFALICRLVIVVFPMVVIIVSMPVVHVLESSCVSTSVSNSIATWVVVWCILNEFLPIVSDRLVFVGAATVHLVEELWQDVAGDICLSAAVENASTMLAQEFPRVEDDCNACRLSP